MIQAVCTYVTTEYYYAFVNVTTSILCLIKNVISMYLAELLNVGVSERFLIPQIDRITRRKGQNKMLTNTKQEAGKPMYHCQSRQLMSLSAPVANNCWDYKIFIKRNKSTS